MRAIVFVLEGLFLLGAIGSGIAAILAWIDCLRAFLGPPDHVAPQDHAAKLQAEREAAAQMLLTPTRPGDYIQ